MPMSCTNCHAQLKLEEVLLFTHLLSYLTYSLTYSLTSLTSLTYLTYSLTYLTYLTYSLTYSLTSLTYSLTHLPHSLTSLTQTVWVNCYHAYPAGSPFGGRKSSGFGRETHKMMLNHYRHVKNMLISYDKNKLGFF